MGKTDKDQPYQRKRQRYSSEPSWWRKMLRRRHRNHVKQDIRNKREPEPRYPDDRDWYW